jgi:hypothetical protein
MRFIDMERTMRRVAAGLIVGIMGSVDGLHADYVIKLKNGNEYVTERYWHQGGQVFFDNYGGIFGIAKGFVAKIEKSDKPIHPITQASAPSNLDRVNTEEKGGEDGNNKAADKEPPLLKRNERDPIFKNFQTVKERAKNLEGMLTSELTQLVKDLADLKRAFQLSGKTNEFLTEFGEINDLADRVEELLKGRR